MKNLIGKIGGFILGAITFLTMFKLIILNNTSPNDELAPGIVLLCAIFIGLLFAFIGSKIQNHLTNK